MASLSKKICLVPLFARFFKSKDAICFGHNQYPFPFAIFFSKNNFAHTPEGDGAWICKNSWGTDWGDGGYYYLSYYDKSLTGFASGFTFDNVEHYETLYQNELSGISGTFDYDTYGQIYKSESGDIIAAVGTYFEEAKTPYTIKIFLSQ